MKEFRIVITYKTRISVDAKTYQRWLPIKCYNQGYVDFLREQDDIEKVEVEWS